MKNYLQKTLAVSTACAAFALTAATLPSVHAQAPAATQEAAATASLSVSVPAGSAPVTYTVDGQTVTIQPGESGTIPANATGIQLPAGCTVTATVTDASGETTTSSYSTESAVTLDAVTPAAISANASAFTPAVAPAGGASAQINALVNAVQVISANTVNPATISDGVSTDGN